MNLFEEEKQAQPLPPDNPELSFQIVFQKPKEASDLIKLLCNDPINLDNVVSFTINYKLDMKAFTDILVTDTAMSRIQDLINLANSDKTIINMFDTQQYNQIQEKIESSIAKLVMFNDCFQKLAIAIKNK